MIKIIPSAERYHFETDWLSTYWHFSFDHYHDPQNVSFGPLRVFNDDTIRPAGGFPLHSHREMEILTYVTEGQLEHQDSLGNRGVIGPGELQRMSAGKGIRHSEYNASKTEPVHLLQFWIDPEASGLEPSWEQRRFTREERRGRLLLVASGKPQDGALHIHQDASVYVASLEKGDNVAHTLASGRRAYLFVISGGSTLNGQPLAAGDQARLTDEKKLALTADNPAELLLVDLP
ncbi:MAG: pirin family protein [Candidatus Acidiferrales bacterium]